jgi:hypothetical protein
MISDIKNHEKVSEISVEEKFKCPEISVDFSN